MAKHSPRFLRLVAEAKKEIRELTVHDVKTKLDRGDSFRLIDVREDNEWAGGHLPGAEHLSKGIIERDIENCVPDTAAEIVVYCGGGFRSALAAASLQRMGYASVFSMDGGFRGWREANYPVEKD